MKAEIIKKTHYLKKMLSLGVSLCLFVVLCLHYDIDAELIRAFDFSLFLALLLIAMLLSMLGSVRLYYNLKPFYCDLSFGRVHSVNVLSMVSGLYFAGIIGSVVTKVSLPMVDKVNKNLIIIISIVEKIITLGFMCLFGLGSFLIINNESLTTSIQIENGFDFVMLSIVMVVILFCYFKQFIKDLYKVISAFFSSTCFYSFFIVLFNLLPAYLIFNNIAVELSIFEKILYSSALMFAGSLPISFQGIGVREATALYLLSGHEIDNTLLLGSILMISLSSILAITLMPMTIKLFGGKEQIQYTEKKKTVSHSSLLNIEENLGIFSIPCLILCLFETKISILSNVIPFSIGDSFAIVLFFILVGSFVNGKIDTLLKRLCLVLFSIFSYFFLSFLFGWYNTEFSAWAFKNRLVGALLLLGYVQAGFFFAVLDRVLIKKVFLILLAIISTYLCFYLALNFFDWPYNDFFQKLDDTQFIGSGNLVTTFAFLICIYILFFSLSFETGAIGKRILIAAQFLLSFCIGLTQSISGMLALSIVGIMLGLRGRTFLKAAPIFIGILFSLVISTGIYFHKNNQTTIYENLNIQNETNTIISKKEVIHKFKYWKKSGKYFIGLIDNKWITGIGLGGTVREIQDLGDSNKLSYNSVLLYLVDTGLIGIIFIGFFFYWLYSQIPVDRGHKDVLRHSFYMAMVIICLFSITSDISYQRILWIWVGMFVSYTSQARKTLNTFKREANAYPKI